MMGVIYTFAAVFVLSAVLLFVFHRLFKLTIPAYIIAGMIGGAFLTEEGLLELLKWGIAFVVFIFGAKMEPDKLKHCIGGSLLSVGVHITAIGLGFFGILYLTGFGALNSIFISAALVFSSSLTGTELSEKYATIELLYGRLAETIDIIHDVLAIILLLLLSPILFNVGMGYAVAVAGGMFAFSMIMRSYIFPWLFELSDSSEELMLLSGISLLAIMIALSELAGISIVIGAFFAGIAFSKFPYNIELVESMESLKDFFAAILFFSLGALVASPTIPALSIALIIILVTMFLKPVLTAMSLMQYGYDKRTAYRCALTLDQISEFVLIIAVQAYLVTTIAEPVFQGIILATTVTMITTSITDNYSDKIRNWLCENVPLETPENIQRYHTKISSHLKDHIILVGYDVQGEKIGQYLIENDVDFIVIDLNPGVFESATELKNHIFGSAMDDKVWEKSNYEEASMIISTPPQKNISEKVLSLDTDATKVVRANKFEVANQMLEEGADYVMVPSLLASEQLVDYAEEVIHGDEETISKMRQALLKDLKDGPDGFE